MRGQPQWPDMRGLSTCLVLVLSSAVAAAVVGRQKAEGRYHLNDQEDWAMSRRYQLGGQKEVASNYFKTEMKWKDTKRLNSVFHTIPGWQTKAKTSSIRRSSCWCPKASSTSRSLHQDDFSSAGSTSNRIIKLAVLKALGY